MTRPGRLWAPIDVNLPDDPRIIEAGDGAAFFFVALICLAKRLDADGFISDPQLKKADPRGPKLAKTLADVGLLHREPDGYRIAGWADWHDSAGAREAKRERMSRGASLANHRRWHVAAGRHDPDCSHCASPVGAPGDRVGDQVPDRVGDQVADRVGESHREETEKSKEENPTRVDFEALWTVYPRKIAKQAAWRAYSSTRNKGIDAATLKVAVDHFAAAMNVERRSPEKVMHGSTFFGPDERWRDYQQPPKPPREIEGPPRGEVFMPAIGNRWDQ